MQSASVMNIPMAIDKRQQDGIRFFQRFTPTLRPNQASRVDFKYVVTDAYVVRVELHYRQPDTSVRAAAQKHEKQLAGHTCGTATHMKQQALR